jgi:hypothetical protein
MSHTVHMHPSISKGFQGVGLRRDPSSLHSVKALRVRSVRLP